MAVGLNSRATSFFLPENSLRKLTDPSVQWHWTVGGQRDMRPSSIFATVYSGYFRQANLPLLVSSSPKWLLSWEVTELELLLTEICHEILLAVSSRCIHVLEKITLVVQFERGIVWMWMHQRRGYCSSQETHYLSVIFIYLNLYFFFFPIMFYSFQCKSLNWFHYQELHIYFATMKKGVLKIAFWTIHCYYIEFLYIDLLSFLYCKLICSNSFQWVKIFYI